MTKQPRGERVQACLLLAAGEKPQEPKGPKAA